MMGSRVKPDYHGLLPHCSRWRAAVQIHAMDWPAVLGMTIKNQNPALRWAPLQQHLMSSLPLTAGQLQRLDLPWKRFQKQF